MLDQIDKKKVSKIIFFLILLILAVIFNVLFFSKKNQKVNQLSNLSANSNQNNDDQLGQVLELQENQVIDCQQESKNSEIKKEFIIDLTTLDDKEAYKTKKKEIINVVNQCYTVVIKEAYEPQKNEIAYQQMEFKNKMRVDSLVFKYLPFYSRLNLNNYEGFLEVGLDYVTTDSLDDVRDFYKNQKILNFELVEEEEEKDSIFWENNRISGEGIRMTSVIFNNTTVVHFEYIRNYDDGDNTDVNLTKVKKSS